MFSSYYHRAHVVNNIGEEYCLSIGYVVALVGKESMKQLMLV